MVIKNSWRIVLILICILNVGCRQDGAQRREAQIKEEQKKEEVFIQIRDAWILKPPVFGVKEQAFLGDWAQWRVLTTEVRQKPSTSIQAFQTKARTFSIKIKEVNASIPSALNIPEFKSRLMVLQTKMNTLDLFMNLDQIPVDKIKITIAEINEQFSAIQSQLTEIVLRSEIPLEEGEMETIQQLRDTTRMVGKNMQNPKNLE